MILGISKQFFSRTVHVQVKKLWFLDLGHVFRTRQCPTRQITFFFTCVISRAWFLGPLQGHHIFIIHKETYNV